LDAHSDTSKTLGGDSVLQSLESRLRSSVFQQIETSKGPMRLGDFGVVFQKDGLLAFDQKKFEAQIAADYQKASEFLTGRLGDNGIRVRGFIDNLKNVTTQLLRMPDGLLFSRKKGFQSSINQIDRRIADRQRLIEQKEKMLKEKFSRLEGTISRIKGQGAGVSALGASTPQMPELG